MVFSSLTFLFLFLPAVLLVYFTVPRAGRNAVLFLFSLVFYAWGEPIYVGLMIFSTILDFICGKLVDKYRGTGRQKIGLLISVFVNLGLLFFFKYTDFFIASINTLFGTQLQQLNLPLPIGISFYTFQTMSYTIDVYRGDAKVQNNIISFGAYVSLFPQLIAGPIVRYRDVAEQLDNRTHSWDAFGIGAGRFTVGLFKKVVLANNIGMLWEAVAAAGIAGDGGVGTAGAWLGIVAHAFQYYFDFSGYSDMAIGLGSMFGFTFLENFNYPYTADSVTDFWRRWHMSMGSWFRDYVYIPLGGNKRGLIVQLRNILIVWLLTGLWHGACWNYVLWGLWFGTILLCEKLFLLKGLRRIPAVFRHLYALLMILLGEVLFAHERLADGIRYLGAMFGAGGVFATDTTRWLLLSYLPLLLLCGLASTPLFKNLWQKIAARVKVGVVTAAESAGMACAFAVSLSYLISSSYNPFLYFRF